MALTNQARKALNGVDSIDWSALSHPYGTGADVPGKLRDLLAEPDTDEAIEAGAYFSAYFVCQQTHFGDAAPSAVPFLLRLLAARGVSRRGDVTTSLLSMLRISSDDAYTEVESSLKERVLAAFASESRAIIGAARLLDGTGFDDAVEVLVVAFADTIAPLLARMRVPKRVREIVAETVADGPCATAERLARWAARRQPAPAAWLLAVEDDPGALMDPGELMKHTKWLLAIEEHVPKEWEPSAGEEVSDSEPEPPVVVDWEARYREDCASTPLPTTLAGDREALTELYVAYRMLREIDQVIELSGVVTLLSFQAPAVYRASTMSGSVVLRAALGELDRPGDPPMDSWFDTKGGQRWLAMLAPNPGSFGSFCASCAFLIGSIASR